MYEQRIQVRNMEMDTDRQLENATEATFWAAKVKHCHRERDHVRLSLRLAGSVGMAAVPGDCHGLALDISVFGGFCGDAG